MHPFTKYTFLGFAIVGAVAFAGCASRDANAQPDAGAVAAGAVVMRPILEPPILLGNAVNEYRNAKHRWPRNYDELSNFLKQTGDKSYPAFLSVKFRRIDSAETADGKLRMKGDYTFTSADTNSDGTVDSSGTARIEGMNMTVSPSDPAR